MDTPTPNDQKGEEKYFHIENITKNLLTTIIGCALMCVSAIAFMIPWFVVLKVQPPAPWILGVVFAIGFMLLFARDKVITYIDVFTRKKIDSTK
jgi:hypothetical protein